MSGRRKPAGPTAVLGPSAGQRAGGRPAPDRVPAEAAPPGETLSGHLDGVDAEGRLLFRPEGSPDRIPVAIGLPLSDDDLVKAARLGRRALVIRTADRAARHVLVGLLRERVSTAARDAALEDLKAVLDGETVILTAKTRIELVCGRSRIVLDRDGRIEISGGYLLSRSRGPVKIKGATVEIN